MAFKCKACPEQESAVSVDPMDGPACKAGGKQKKAVWKALLQESKHRRASDVSKVKMAVQLGYEAEETILKEEGNREDKGKGVTILSIWYIFGDTLIVTLGNLLRVL